MNSSFLESHEIFTLDPQRMTMREVRATIPNAQMGGTKPLRLIKNGLIDKAQNWLSDEKNQSITEAIYMMGIFVAGGALADPIQAFSVGMATGRIMALNDVTLSVENSVITQNDINELRTVSKEHQADMLDKLADWAAKEARRTRRGDDSSSPA